MAENTFKIQFEDGTTKTATVKISSPKDIIMFVAGTTDPVNSTGLKHQSNSDYWRMEKEGIKNLRASVEDLKLQFIDLHIEAKSFSWTGDNNNENRTKGGEGLLDLFLRYYKGWLDEEVYLHLIGHSHGGNVINEFTNIIASDPNFPKKWQCRTITYLSTPFFKEQHQLNHTKLHSNCKIINVHNEYDITQRFVADFSLKNLEVLIANFNKEDFEAAKARIKETDFKAFEHISDIVMNNHTEGPFLWGQTVILLDGIKQYLTILVKKVKCFETTTILSAQKSILLGHLNDILDWATTRGAIFEANQTTRSGGYGRSEFFDEIDLIGILGIINVLFAINKGEEDSYLLGLLNSIAQTDTSGIVDQIDDTSWSPEKQVKGKFEIIDVPITTEDDYHSKGKKSSYDSFITGVEGAVKKNKGDIREVAMRLISQLMEPDYLEKLDEAIDSLDTLATLNFGSLDTALKLARDNFKKYRTLINKYNKKLVTDTDLKNKKLEVKPGSLVYLATKSHSLSHSKLFPKVEEALRANFETPVNKGYKKK
ncbi:hypothetical protein [Ulvibacter litoralis]|uniref:Uncharacterized protein n=1 Tax=Ulvibacter litoralis TaxID=227084 RepID=A0A1G7FQ95_9FLAO|nr:hypothetical protein [Ulvibacter litoralis]GHC50184.1 hypothetical protein GCM10008083_12100 [Ulvibacter litoralis]SDE78073.1 hypothetical protein SAMN05421855_102702 [Ulvibacter litoralis]